MMSQQCGYCFFADAAFAFPAGFPAPPELRVPPAADKFDKFMGFPATRLAFFCVPDPDALADGAGPGTDSAGAVAAA